MAEYIDREAAISILNTAGFWDNEDREVAIACVEQTTAADVAPVKHGKWFGTVCSNCGARARFYHDCDYCPNCGARMDLEE